MNFKALGSIAIVAGTAIGAGMLALPLATAALGFTQAMILMVAIWLLSAYTGLLMLEVNLRSGVGDNLHAIAGKFLGKPGQVVMGVSMLGLLYSITAAYLTGGASLLVARAEGLFGVALNNEMAVLLFTLVLGAVAAIGVAWVDKFSRLAFSVMMAILVVVLFALVDDVAVGSLSRSLVEGDQGLGWMQAIPVVFTSFGFHVCIASLVGYLQGEAKPLRKVLLIGSTIPLACYTFWLIVSFGTVGIDNLASFEGGVAEMIQAMQQASSSTWIGNLVFVFADLALITSFLGVTLSLFDFLSELTRAKPTLGGRARTALITYIPPVLLAIYYPEGFVALLGFAAIPLVFMVLVLPVMEAIKQRAAGMEGYQVSGGMPALIAVLLSGVVIIGAQFVAVFSG
ncbi:aromatic amino acid transport family protein [Paraferrimonas sedimenticola]|uniref:Amino acid permease n=1 Tax=Paraferrimonas sedimenticola TaxID=375674 RepID=A0AA37RZV9_9GAMM|nr:aromatic amino acid transport family protein [Paraferrimonas sedimenticola]GLP98144.1 amino acid permease [Paraferrimonas sedimenticola]